MVDEVEKARTYTHAKALSFYYQIVGLSIEKRGRENYNNIICLDRIIITWANHLNRNKSLMPRLHKKVIERMRDEHKKKEEKLRKTLITNWRNGETIFAHT
jgi:hypothetical protein